MDQAKTVATTGRSRGQRTGSRKLKPFDEQVIVITGASSGIGLTTARMAAGRGARVVLAARSEDALGELTDKITERGGEAIYVVADVSDQEDVREIARVAEETYGGFDTWVNVAESSLYTRAVQQRGLTRKAVAGVTVVGTALYALYRATRGRD